MKVVLIDKELFWKKLLLLVIASVLLIPILVYKPAILTKLYLVALFLTHVYFAVVYSHRTPWREFLREKKLILFLRVASTMVFAYLLSKLRIDENLVSVIYFLVLSFFAHLVMLLALSLRVSFEIFTTPSSLEVTEE